MAIQVRQATNRRGARVGIKTQERDPVSAAGVYRDYDAFDRFNRANAALGTTPTGGAWSYNGQDFDVISNTAYLSSTAGSGNEAANFTLPGSDDVYMRFTFKTVNAVKSAGISIRYGGETDRVFASWQPNGSVFQIWYNDGSWNGAASTGGTMSSGDVFSMTAIGTTITSYKNGVQVASGTVGAGQAAGTAHGFQNENTNNDARFEDLVVRII